MPYRVREGQVLPHGGQDIPAGEIVQLPPHVAVEVKHLVEAVDAAGRVIAAPTDVEVGLARVRPHERVSILKSLRDKVAADLADLDARIGAEEAAAQPAKKKAEPSK